MAVAARALRHEQPAVRRAQATTAARVRSQTGGRRLPFLIFAMMVITALVVGLVSAHVMVAQDSFRLSELTERADRLEGEYGELRLELARLSSPDRIAAAAKQAGLVLPERVELLKVPGVPEIVADPPESSGSLALKGVLGGEG